MKILFFGKRDNRYSDMALSYLRANNCDMKHVLGNRDLKFDPEIYEGLGWAKFDLVISYLWPWVLPEFILKTGRMGALNFHPGPPEYPGIGCTNFAIYEGAKEFGATCNIMETMPDTGSIIKVSRFAVHENETVSNLTERTYAHLFMVFMSVVDDLLTGKPLVPIGDVWSRPASTRRQLDDLCLIDREMDKDEIDRRIRATTFPGKPGARICFGDKVFEYVVKSGER